MTPFLTVPPVAFPVGLDDAKTHCRVDHADDDALITGYIGAAVAHFDGWSGVLGRCIMPQTWRVTLDAGDHVLPMPDVTSAVAGYAAGSAPLDLIAGPSGPCITLSEACDVTFSCAMPAHLLPAVRVAVLLLVGHWYDVRAAVSAGMAETPMTVEMLLAPLRCRRI